LKIASAAPKKAKRGIERRKGLKRREEVTSRRT